MEHNRHCDTIGEVYGNSRFGDFTLKVDNNWPTISSQGNHDNGITISNEKTHTDCKVLVVTPEQSKHNKPVDMAIVSMIPQEQF